MYDYAPALGSGSEGLTLTQANHVILVDRGYKPAAEDQAFSRVYRPGQAHKVVVKWYMASMAEERVGQV